MKTSPPTSSPSTTNTTSTTTNVQQIAHDKNSNIRFDDGNYLNLSNTININDNDDDDDNYNFDSMHHNVKEKFVIDLLDTEEKDINVNDLIFDEDAYIRSILENQKNQIDDIDNNNTELSEFEKDILAKYMNEFECEKRPVVIDERPLSTCSPVLNRFPVKESNENRTTFPIKFDQIVQSQQNNELQSTNIESNTLDEVSLLSTASSSSSSLSSSPSPPINVDDENLINSSTQVAFSQRNCTSNSRNIRNVLRRNFSIWVGVTSCVWGLLLYIDKNYF